MINFGRKTRPLPVLGFTLIEVMLALTVMAIIVYSLQSVALMASKASTSDKFRPAISFSCAKALESIGFELPFATSIVSSNGRMIEFTVPDRTGDGAAETIRYSWSGVTGDPLLRTMNGGANVIVVPRLSKFDLTYVTTSQTTQNSTESPETVLQSYDTLLSLGDFNIQSKNWIGQYFTPNLPTSATAWRVTRVRVKAKTHGANSGETRVQLRKALNGLPTTVLEESIMYESALGSSYTWQDISFTSVNGLSPTSGLCLVLQWQKDADACDVQYQGLAALGASTNLLKTTDGGATWSAPLAQDLMFYVYGTYSTPGGSTTTYSLNSVQCAVASTLDPNSQAVTTFRIHNRPAIATP